MSKQNLIDTIALETNTSKAEAGRMVDAVEAMGDYEYSGYGVPFDFAAAH